ncbi:S4A10 protein, partial [Geococcyx californianus]|nr:S4A10 protein [Geococcyx californianus]
RFLFVLLGPEGKAHQYHEIGRSMATIMTDEVFHDVAYKAKNRADLVAGIDEFLDQVTVLPPGEWDPSIRIEPPKNVPSQKLLCACRFPPAAKKTHHGLPGEPSGFFPSPRLFGGLILDVKRKAPWFWSDFRDGLSLQCLASFLFLYCACMSPVITFGGLLGEATSGHISAMESLLGASMTGVVYSLFAGQPLTILGSTGPVLVFEKILYKFCSMVVLARLPHSLSLCSQEFPVSPSPLVLSSALVACHSSRGCATGLRNGVSSHLTSPLASVELSVSLLLLNHKPPAAAATRSRILDQDPPEPLVIRGSLAARALPLCPDTLFPQECRYLHGEFQGPACGRHGPYTPNVLFWCCILFFSTFVLSSLLKKFKTSRYFPTRVRSTVSDFAVFLTIVVMVLIDFMIGIPSPKLHVPHMFKPTRDDRGWIINPIGPNPWWTVLAALIPALLCTILIFMDQQITAVIVNRKEHRLK